MDGMFEFDLDEKNEPKVTLHGNGLSFNRFSIEALGFPEFVNIGIDRANKRLGIKAADKADNVIRKYPFVVNEKTRKHGVISNSELYKQIQSVTETNPPRGGVKCRAEFDTSLQMLVVILRKSK